VAPRGRRPSADRHERRWLGIGKRALQLEAAQSGAERHGDCSRLPYREQPDHERRHIRRDQSDPLPGLDVQARSQAVGPGGQLLEAQDRVAIGDGGPIPAVGSPRTKQRGNLS
jgi:hypothetical protein